MQVPWFWPFGQVAELSPLELQTELGRNGHSQYQLIDVREQVEFRRGHIAGARNIPLHELPQRLETLDLDPRRPVVAICLSGHRSIPAYRLLRQKGYRVYSLRGGMMNWWRAQGTSTREASR